MDAWLECLNVVPESPALPTNMHVLSVLTASTILARSTCVQMTGRPIFHLRVVRLKTVPKTSYVRVVHRV